MNGKISKRSRRGETVSVARKKWHRQHGGLAQPRAAGENRPAALYLAAATIRQQRENQRNIVKSGNLGDGEKLKAKNWRQMVATKTVMAAISK